MVHDGDELLGVSFLQDRSSRLKGKKIVSSSKQYGEEEEGWVRYSVGVHAASSGRPSWPDVATAWPFLRGRVRARHNTIII